MTASLRNAYKRKTHKERAQPAARRKYGLLEKKKDYLLRAKDFHKKEKTIQTLRQKAEERNPDEFYFAMEKARTREGIHIAGRDHEGKYTQEELRLMKTQDIKYVALKAQTEAKKVERLQAQLHMLDAPRQNKHTVFVDDPAEVNTFSAEEYFDTPAELLDQSHNRLRKEQLEDPAHVKAAEELKKKRASLGRKKDAAYRELQQRTERHQKLSLLVQKWGVERQVMGNGHKWKVAAGEEGKPAVFKWRQERKK